MSARTQGPADPTVRDRWTLRSGETWQSELGLAMSLEVLDVLGQEARLGFTLAAAKELQHQLTLHIVQAELDIEMDLEMGGDQ